MSESVCEVCGSAVRVVGDTTLHHERVEQPEGVAQRVMRRFEGGDIEYGEGSIGHLYLGSQLKGARTLHAELSAEARRVLGEAFGDEYVDGIKDLAEALGLDLNDPG